MGTIWLGTSGWDYPEWVGRVYPPRDVSDRLGFYAQRFAIVEVNSSFYRLPRVDVVASWARRTPKGFRFAAKFPQTITHERRLERTGEELARFLAAIQPLRDAGKFAAALVQLPPSLTFEPRRTRAFYESLPVDLPVAVEFREESWLDPASFDLLREFHLAYVIIDEPVLPVRVEVTAPFAYVRWHGHGHPTWYDYTYSTAELASWVPRLAQLSAQVDTVYGFFNNHFRGDAAVNCERLRESAGMSAPSWSRRIDA
ncbi:MAG: DUF72 domain-containing protein [Thermoplasmata archaeon]|nr:DUF72 domain-containing protein [Thermoplasmata archaeon]